MESINIQEFIKSITEPLGTNATVKKVFGEPINAHGKTIIPVAQIAYGFGGGAGEKNKAPGSKEGESSGKGPNEGGAGMGGGMAARPIGFIEVTPEKTQFVRFAPAKYVIAGVALGILAGKYISHFLKK